MSDASEKPFEATPHRIARARREGNVARSSEFAANLSFFAGGATLVAIAPALAAIACRSLTASVSGAIPADAVLIVGSALLPVGAAALAGTLGHLLQNGGLVVLALEPKFERLNPLEGLKRILSRETVAHSLRASLAFGFAATAMAPFIAWTAASVPLSGTPASVTAAAWMAAREVAAAAAGVGFCFAIAEYAAARNVWLRKLRMSFEERKREAKEEEGDAGARGRRRALHRSLLRTGMGRVREAAFVVANPDHVAVALEYRPPRVAVPRVLMRAADTAAVRLREAAARYRIPVVENIPLARALYRDGRVGEVIPHDHYVAVAEVVSALMRVKELA